MNWKTKILGVGLMAFSLSLSAQDQAPENWFNLDLEQDKVHGVSAEKAYQELLKGKEPKKKVIVAIIDSGVDPEHEDLKEVMWVNEDEIPGNGIDDDKNGYVDDIHGWNFIGGKDGKNVYHENLELTRLYRELKEMPKRNKKQQKYYEKLRDAHEKKVTEMKQGLATYEMINAAIETLEKATGKEDFTVEDLNKLPEDAEEGVVQAKNMLAGYMGDRTGAQFKEGIQGALSYFGDQLEYYLNLDFDPRDIVGDDYSNQNERIYGNNDVYGADADADHGTHVAGIVGAVRGNDVGMDGVANNVLLMSIRCVPNGDERDKDVANSIRYAVDNGADVINMSFGKAYSYKKKIVDKAVKYAEKKGVLLVHAAGNDNKNIDKKDNFPTKFYMKGKDPSKRGKKVAKNWIEVGALSWKGGEDATAVFSNYGEATVDLFAPGVDIYSTLPEEKYAPLSGTSMAAPVVAGVAALVKSYYPELDAAELKECLEKSVVPVEYKVKRPGSMVTVDFEELCITGGVVNAYNALKLAEKMTSGK
jgi:cell wall-associated protease